MRAVAAAGAGFLLAVLWFDLMFDVQVRGHRAGELPSRVRDSIAAYYARVITGARPMNRFVAAAMVVTLAALVGELVRGDAPVGAAAVSLVLTTGAVGLAAARTVRRAARLGAQSDPPALQSTLARAIFRDHVLCFGAIALTLILQLALA